MSNLNIKTSVNVADDTLPIIVGIAATSVEGVASLGEGVTFKAMPFIGANSLKKGIVVTKEEKGDNVVVKITVVLKQGVDIKKVCYNIQEKAKESIESMLDLTVKEVIVKVAKLDDV